MLRQGPVAPFIHGLVEYAVGGLLIAAPFLFGYDAGAATAVSIVVGVVVLIVAAASDMPAGLSKTIPVGIHVVLDFALAAFLIASPFLFGYSDEAAPTALNIALGVFHVLVTIATRFERKGRSAAQASSPPRP